MTFVLGLTGSIGMGKSTTAKLFAEAGVAVWDADAAVHKLYAPGGKAALALQSVFPDVLAADGAVNRDALRALIAKDPSVLDRINALVHPLVAQDRAEFLARHTDVVVLDVPLLFETGLDKACDKVVVVSTDAKTQADRVLSRGTMTREDFETILSRQMPDAEKRARADYLILTNTLEQARADVHKILTEIRGQIHDA